jgi:hypothetical protein
MPDVQMKFLIFDFNKITVNLNDAKMMHWNCQAHEICKIQQCAEYQKFPKGSNCPTDEIKLPENNSDLVKGTDTRKFRDMEIKTN